MSDHVEFEEDQVGRSKTFGQTQARKSSSGGMAGWLIRHGFISSDSGAKVFLASIIIIDFLAAALIIYFFVWK